MKLNAKDAERFKESFDRCEDGCWRWLKGKSPKGYGTFSVKGHPFRAHRISYEMFNGEIPEGLWVLHSCDHPECVNPLHLRLGTHTDNVRDKVERHRQFKPSGELHPLHKLAADDVRAIRKSVARGCSLARRYGISQATVCDIRSRRSWADIQ